MKTEEEIQYIRDYNSGIIDPNDVFGGNGAFGDRDA